MQYLILHKVRGEGAFDIAEPMHVEELNETWWIIPTSGHRAYPYWVRSLEEILTDPRGGPNFDQMELYELSRNPPTELRDHYTVLNPPPAAAAKRQSPSIAAPTPEDL